MIIHLEYEIILLIKDVFEIGKSSKVVQGIKTVGKIFLFSITISSRN